MNKEIDDVKAVANPGKACGSVVSELRLRETSGEKVSWILPNRGTLATPGAKWKSDVKWTPVAGRSDCVDGVITVTLTEGASDGAVFDLVCRFSNWDICSYVFAPSIVYNGNRFESVNVGYSPFWPDSSYYRLDPPVSVTDQPLLNIDGRPAKIELDTGNCATPCLGFRSPEGRGFLLLTDQGSGFGNHGLTIAEDGPAKTASFTVTTPKARSRVVRMMGFADGDKPQAWTAGDSATMRVRLWSFEAPRLSDFFARFAEARKDLGPRTWKNLVPFSAAADAIRDKLNAQNWDEEVGYYRHDPTRKPSTPDNFKYWWQLGWVSGGITTLPMLLDGDETARANALRNLEFMFVESPVENGLWKAAHDGETWLTDDPRKPKPGYQLSVRRLVDAVFYGLKQVRILKEKGEPVPESWDKSMRNLVDSLMRVWEQDGQMGQYLDIRSGRVLIGNSTAGAMLPAGLVLAAQHWNEPAYLAVAETIARQYVKRDLGRGVINGGPCDALSAPDSESGFALVMSLVALHEATGKKEWADASREAIHHFSSWVVSYDYALPSGSALEKAGVHTTGGVWANVQNKHASPGICTASGDALLRHWRATGDVFALELLRDIAHNMTFYASLAERPLGEKMWPGTMCERVNLSDWERGKVGANLFGSTIWVETAMLLTASEIPGIHVQRDTGTVTVFDHVEARLLNKGGKQVLHLRNPTAFDARYSVLVESTEQMACPLPVETLRDARRPSIGAGSEMEIVLDGAGQPVLVNRTGQEQ